MCSRQAGWRAAAWPRGGGWGRRGGPGPAGGPGSPVAPGIAPVPEVRGQAADLVDTLTVRPNLPGRNVFSITVADTRRPAPAPIIGLSLRLTGPDGAATVHPVVRGAD